MNVLNKIMFQLEVFNCNEMNCPSCILQMKLEQNHHYRVSLLVPIPKAHKDEIATDGQSICRLMTRY